MSIDNGVMDLELLRIQAKIYLKDVTIGWN